MTYETYLPGYGTMMHTSSLEAVDTQEKINLLSKSGYKFKVDGKVVSKDNVHSAIAKSLGIAKSQVEKSIVGHLEKHESGSSVTSIEIEDTISDKPVSQPVAPTRRKVTKIRCKETGGVYKNMTEAGKALGIDPASISEAVKLGRPRGGYHFERVEE